jgi:amphi-Trp domain-containing protein
MPEEVLFETERRQSRSDIAALLRTVADNLDSGEPITLRAGGEELTMTPPTQPTFEVKAEREGPEGGPKELSVEFELEWDEGDGSGDGGGPLEIE